MSTYLITGVSSGIGRAVVEALIERGHAVLGALRSPDAVAALGRSFGPAFQPAVMDVADARSVHASAHEWGSNGTLLNGIVNCAGTVKTGPLLLQDPAEIRDQFETNALGPLHVIQAFAPLLVDKRTAGALPRRIVNVSSVGGRFVLPFMGGYSASKFALEALSDALRRELLPEGIGVVVVQPGPTKSDIWKKTDRGSSHPYRGTSYEDSFEHFQRAFLTGEKDAVAAAEVAEAVAFALTARKVKPRIVVMKDRFRRITVPHFLPSAVVDRAIGTKFGLFRRCR